MEKWINQYKLGHIRQVEIYKRKMQSQMALIKFKVCSKQIIWVTICLFFYKRKQLIQKPTHRWCWIFLLTVNGEKSFKGKSIAEITYSFWILGILLSLKDREWILSVEMFNRGHRSVLHYSLVWLYMHTCHRWLPLWLISRGKAYRV